MSMRTKGTMTGAKIGAAAMLAVLLSAISPAGTASASGPSRQDDGYGRQRGSEIRIYGTVRNMPDGLLGTWDVNGKEITVTKETRIKEKHGRAETGAFVEIEGSYRGRIFRAEEIEVKRARR